MDGSAYEARRLYVIFGPFPSVYMRTHTSTVSLTDSILPMTVIRIGWATGSTEKHVQRVKDHLNSGQKALVELAREGSPQIYDVPNVDTHIYLNNLQPPRENDRSVTATSCSSLLFLVPTICSLTLYYPPITALFVLAQLLRRH